MVISKKIFWTQTAIIILAVLNQHHIHGMNISPRIFCDPKSLLMHIQQLAIKNDIPTCVTLLQDAFVQTFHDTPCDIKDEQNQTALHLACQEGYLRCVEIILQSCPPETIWDELSAPMNDGITPLHCAAKNGHKEIVKKILLMKYSDNQTILHLAALHNHLNLAKEIITQATLLTILDEVLSQKDNHGEQAIDIAERKNFRKVVWLLEAAIPKG